MEIRRWYIWGNPGNPRGVVKKALELSCSGGMGNDYMMEAARNPKCLFYLDWDLMEFSIMDTTKYPWSEYYRWILTSTEYHEEHPVPAEEILAEEHDLGTEPNKVFLGKHQLKYLIEVGVFEEDIDPGLRITAEELINKYHVIPTTLKYAKEDYSLDIHPNGTGWSVIYFSDELFWEKEEWEIADLHKEYEDSLVDAVFKTVVWYQENSWKLMYGKDKELSEIGEDELVNFRD